MMLIINVVKQLSYYSCHATPIIANIYVMQRYLVIDKCALSFKYAEGSK
jgi:hypothetical protein